MGSQSGDDNNANHSQLQPLARQNSMNNLTLDDVQNELGNLETPLSSMNLDELLENVWANEAIVMTIDDTSEANPDSLQCHQTSLPLIIDDISNETMDEIWKDIQQSNDNKCQEREPTLGEMTFENFLLEEGIISESSSTKKNIGPKVDVGSTQTASHNPCIQYPQPHCYQLPQQSLMGNYVHVYNIAQPLQMQVVAPFANGQVPLFAPVMGTLSCLNIPMRRRGAQEEIEKKLAKKQKRMIKNRECAARIRTQKKAYLADLETKVSSLEEENEKLRKLKRFENMLSNAPPTSEPRYQLRRTTSASF